MQRTFIQRSRVCVCVECAKLEPSDYSVLVVVCVVLVYVFLSRDYVTCAKFFEEFMTIE